MQYSGIKAILSSKSLRSVLESKKLAQLGDFLVNFIYTNVKIGKYNIEGSIHVWDVSLTKAMKLANLRQELGRRTKPDKVADAAEALVAYAYFNQLITLDEMVKQLDIYLSIENFHTEKVEKEACAYAFSKLFERIINLIDKTHPLVRLKDE